MEKVQSQAEMTWSDTTRQLSCNIGSVMETRNCVICGAQFPARRQADKTCSTECQVEHRRNLNREKARRHYKPRAPRPDAVCQGCRASIPTPRTGPSPKWCTPCRANKEGARAKARYVGERRSCYKCGASVPEAVGRPGKTVCHACRIDRRTNGQQRERRRLLRKYGITQDEYDGMLRAQGGRCAICRTDNPGPKGFAIDHCHTTGRVRAILCNACNTALGLIREDPDVAQAMAEYARHHGIE